MANTVTVMGVADRPMGGLKESLSVFTRHHAEVAGALLNISGIGTPDGEPLDKDDPRPQYNPDQHRWPTAMHHADGRVEQAQDKEAVAGLTKLGFRREPYRVPQVAVADPATEKKFLMDQLAEQRQQNNVLNDSLAKLQERLAALEAK